MNTKLLMTISSLMLGLAGIFALFAPEVLLTTLNVPAVSSLTVLVQLLGALYFSFALMNWTAKDSAIGGIYARPVSLANFGHFFSGSLILVKHLLSTEFNLTILLVSILYASFAVIFYWLVFRATGIAKP
jgi:hypothetical protein